MWQSRPEIVLDLGLCDFGNFEDGRSQDLVTEYDGTDSDICLFTQVDLNVQFLVPAFFILVLQIRM